MTRPIIIIAVAVAAVLTNTCKANPQAAIKTNLLYDATLSPNLGVELTVAPHWSVELSGNYNGWNISDTRRWKHWFLQPEARYWLKESLKGHFLAANLIGGQFNTTFKNARRQGLAVGIGVGYGHTWRLGRHWGATGASRPS